MNKILPIFFLLFLPLAIAASPILVATDRTCEETQGLERFTCDSDTTQGLRFISATKSDSGKWEVEPQDHLASGMGALNLQEDLVLYVHGDGKDFQEVLERSQKIHELYGVTVLAFDYPSYVPGMNGLRNYYNSRANARRSLPEFRRLLRQLTVYFDQESYDGRKTLFLHSLGNHVIELATVDESTVEMAQALFDNIVLNSACVDLKGHHEWVEDLAEDQSVYITYNKKDHVLKGAMMITFKRKLGAKIRGPVAENAHYINFREVAYLEHNYFLKPKVFQKHSAVKDFYRQVLHGETIDLANNPNYTPRSRKPGYTIGR